MDHRSNQREKKRTGDRCLLAVAQREKVKKSTSLQYWGSKPKRGKRRKKREKERTTTTRGGNIECHHCIDLAIGKKGGGGGEELGDPQYCNEVLRERRKRGKKRERRFCCNKSSPALIREGGEGEKRKVLPPGRALIGRGGGKKGEEGERGACLIFGSPS